MSRGLCALFLSLFAVPAMAQDLRFDPGLVEACFRDAPGPGAECIGTASSQCQAQNVGGYSTAGMANCTAQETAAWDDLLNREYRALRADLDRRDDGVGMDRSDALRDAQRAWIAYRDAECTLQWARYQEGTIRTLIAGGCQLDFTAGRTLELRDMRREPQ